ncbi:MAG: hypothetical protein NT121_05760 [Chloroflexi bacterium]|nr:hypothetical protein [Chloroflexota bacterium]
MLKKTSRYVGALLTLGLLALFSLASHVISPAAQADPTPSPKEKLIPLVAQAGKSDGILILGILIFIFIAIPILLRYRETKSS